MAYAPIVLFTYNRLEELQFTVSALQKNILASESTLTIYSDAPKTDADAKKVNTVREYLQTIDGFKSVLIIHRPENFGLARSIIEGVTEILEKYGKIIVLEDDLLTSENFLLYMNDALDFYEKYPKIFSISAYTMPLKSLKKYEKDTYVALRPASWGWGTWKDQWENIDWDVKDYETFIKNPNSIEGFNRGGVDLTRMLKNYMQRQNNSWAIRWSYAMYKAGKYSIYPKLSKVQNIGFSDDATHCTNEHIYKTNLDVGTQRKFDFMTDILLQKQITNDFKNIYEFHNKFLRKMKIKLNNYLSYLQKWKKQV